MRASARQAPIDIAAMGTWIRSRWLWCAAMLLMGSMLWLGGDRGRPQLAALVGQFAVFAAVVCAVVIAAGGRMEGGLRRAADALDGLGEPRFVASVVGGALALRLGLALVFPDPLSSDAYWYHARAVDLLEGRGYVRPGPVVEGLPTFIPTAFWPVGYPAFLAGVYSITGASWRVGIAVNAVLSSLSVWVLYRIGVGLYGRRAGRLAAMLICLCPVLWPRTLMSEPLCTLLMMVAVWLVLARRCGVPTALTAGLILAAATYVRANAVLFVAVLGFIWWIRTQRLWRAVGLGLVSMAVVVLAFVPWVRRNARELGASVPTFTNSGVNLLIGACEGCDGRAPQVYAGPAWDEVMRLRLVEYDEIASDRCARRAALSYIGRHPWHWLGLGVAKVMWMSLLSPWHPPFALFGDGSRPLPGAEVGFKAICRAATWAVLLAFVYYACWCGREARRPGRAFDCKLLVPLVAWLVVAGQAFVFHGVGRFRLPTEGLVILAVAFAVLAAADQRRDEAMSEV